MSEITEGARFLKELVSEAAASRKCLERIPESLFDWKPHEKSMKLGYLALLVAEIPRWITLMIEDSVIDFATFGHFEPQNTDELVKHFDENLAVAKSRRGARVDQQDQVLLHLRMFPDHQHPL